MFENNTILKIGDWVKGQWDGGLIIGYIESQENPRIVKVRIVTSDNNEIIGKTVSMLSVSIKKLPDSNVTNKAQIQNLIDLALLTGDEEWFIELSSKLKAMNELVKQS
ncbi:IDEAL domain-containing protein [Bacillus sp. USDA818B3_A]|uniref:IDEAL domain-containing protein n=1 Tax=Bacillus sp. USDA818B3_A TaxID=2698834 RepID=UPI00136A116D|nr:IDEAL domain-containing protein [Bacillus sp. USDA818B3_A]